MKKFISFLLIIFICFNFIIPTYSFAYSIKNIGCQEKSISSETKEAQDNRESIVDHNKLHGIEPLKSNQIVLSRDTKSNVKNIKYLAVFIEFSNSDNAVTNHLDDDKSVENAEKIFNSEELFEMDSVKGTIKVPSFKKYYEMQSYGKLSITTEIFPKKDGKVVSYQDSHPIGYYLRYNDKNPIGYKTQDESLKRETELINNAVQFVAKQIEDAGIKESEIDTGNDGIVDAISFFVEGQEELPSTISSSDLLWSHKLDNYGITNTILGKRVQAYNLIYARDYTQAAGSFSLNRGEYGVIIHEFGHTLGFMDLYKYGTSSNMPVGFYDIMGETIGSNPQDFLTYFITDYRNDTNWHNPLQVINKTTNNITLYKPEFKDENEKRAIKIKQYSDSEEYFIVEYHDKKNTYDTYSADMSGIIVYRVNDRYKFDGSNGEDDHIFVFRPNETALGDGKGELSKATLNSTRTVLGKDIDKNNSEFDNKTIYYSNGANSGIVINVVSQTDNSITFNVTFPQTDGDGTKSNPYLIYDVNTFLYLMKIETKNKYYKLMNDLDFVNVDNYPKIDFNGNIDGNHKTLKNISATGTGVFNSIGDSALNCIIENLNIENINVNPETGNYLGGFAGTVNNSTLRNIHLKSGNVKNVRSQYNSISSTGGFAGNISNTVIIDNCSASISVESEKNVGGFIGINMNATIKNSYTNGKVTGKTNVGGVIAIQYIDDTVYKVPENVYFDMDKATVTNAVGGYATFGHNLTTLPEKDLGKGIVGISVPKEINISGAKAVNYNITTNPSKSLPVIISISDSTIARYANNKIQGIKNGTAKIFVDLKIGTQIMKMESSLKVTNINTTIPDINITSIVLNKNSAELKENEYIQLSAILTPSNHTMSKEIKWKSSNSNIATVDSNGKVKAISEGKATITATTINGKSASCVVTVNKKSVIILEEDVLKQFGLTKKDGYIVGFKTGSNVSSIRTMLSSYPNVTLSSFKDASGKDVTNGIVATNMKFTLTFNGKQYNYIIVIKGDVNGDGLIYATDYVCIKNHIMGKKKLQGAYLKAADINNDNNVYATDYVKIKNYIMGKGTIEQK